MGEPLQLKGVLKMRRRWLIVAWAIGLTLSGACGMFEAPKTADEGREALCSAYVLAHGGDDSEVVRLCSALERDGGAE